MSWICYTTCDEGQRYGVPEDSVVLSFDPKVIAVVLANIEHTAANIAEDGNKIAGALVEQGVDEEAADQVRTNAADMAKSAARCARHSKYKAEAFLCAPHGFRGLVHTITRCDWKEMVAYTSGVGP